MLPITWRYLLKNHLKLFSMTASAFTIVLIVTRLEEAAQLASIGANISQILLFLLYKIPYLLPIVFPLSCLLAAAILFSRLSNTRELTALRSCGMSLKEILAPIILLSFVLCNLNFYITSEMATYFHLASKKMIQEIKSINPLVLLQNKKLFRTKQIYLNMKSQPNQDSVSDFILAKPQEKNGGIQLMTAKSLYLNPNKFQGKTLSFISTIPSESKYKFDNLLIENQSTSESSQLNLRTLTEETRWPLNNDHLTLNLLMTHYYHEKKRLKQTNHPIKTKEIKKNINRIRSEFFRRAALALSAMTFTLLGMFYGIRISRSVNKARLLKIIIFTSFFLISFFMGKATEQYHWLACILYFLPQLMIIFYCLRSLSRTAKGVEYT